MLLQLDRLPKQLSQEKAQQWKAWFFEQTGYAEVTELAKALIPIILEIEGKTVAENTVRVALSTFLNGHSERVVQWIGDEPNHYGRALADLVGESTETLAANYLQYLSADFLPSQISAQALDYLPLTLDQIPHPRQPFESLQRWLNEQNRPTLFPKILEHQELSWQELIEGLKELSHHLQSSELATDATFRLIVENTSFIEPLTRELAEQRLQIEFADDPIFVPRQVDEAKTLSIKLAPLTLSAIDDWLSILKERHYLNADEAERVYQSLETFGEQALNRLRPKELLYALQDFRHSLFEGDPAHIYRKQAQWLRRSLKENSKSAIGTRWLELGARKNFFLRWIKEADHLHGSLTRGAAKDCFQFESKTKDEPDLAEIKKTLEHLIHIKSLDELKEIQADFFSLIPGTRDPRWEGFIEETEEKKYELSPDLLELGYAELISTLTPDDLPRLPANFENASIIERALQIASPSTLSTWCKTLLNLPDSSWILLFGALLGLSHRTDLDELLESPLIITCWWRLLAALPSNNDHADLPHLERSMLMISHGLRDLLPIFRSKKELLQELHTHIADEAVTQELIDQALPQLARYIRFQLSWKLAKSLEPALEQVHALFEHQKLSSYWLHLAQSGDLSAKQKLLNRPDLQSHDFHPQRSLSLLKRLQWSLELIHHESWPLFLESDLIEGIDTFEENNDEALRQALKQLLLHRALRPRLSPEFASLLESLAGTKETIAWLLDPLHDVAQHNSPQETRQTWCQKTPVDQIITILTITGDKELAHQIAAFDITTLPRPEYLALFTAQLSPSKAPDASPELRFSRLEKLARLRHHALLLLARWGELSDTFQDHWQIESPQIGAERQRWEKLRTAIRRDTKLPEIDDALWHTILDELCFGQLASIRDEPSFLSSNNLSALEQNELAILAMSALKPHQRWQSLSLFTHQIWKLRHAHLDSLIDSLPNSYPEPRSSHAWSEPQEYLQERKLWAQKHDPKAIKAWCENPLLYRRHDLLDDLSGLAERAWPYLNTEQRAELLGALARGPVDKTWWSRGMELPLKERLYFARTHGTLRQRRQIAQDLLNKYDKDPTEFLSTYFSTLLEKERPYREHIQPKIDAFIEHYKKEPDSKDRHIAAQIIQTTTSPQELLDIFPPLLKSILKKAIADRTISADSQKYLSHIYQAAHKRVSLSTSSFRDLQSRLDSAKNRLSLQIESLPDDEHRPQLKRQLNEVFSALQE